MVLFVKIKQINIKYEIIFMINLVEDDKTGCPKQGIDEGDEGIT